MIPGYTLVIAKDVKDSRGNLVTGTAEFFPESTPGAQGVILSSGYIAGSSAVSIGAWNPGVYSVGDVVRYTDGNAYVCVTNGTAAAPGISVAGWLQIPPGALTAGQTTTELVTAPIKAGAFALLLPDVSMTVPVNFSFSVKVHAGGKTALEYHGVQPKGAILNFDQYVPVVPYVPFQEGPAGTIQIGSVVSSETTTSVTNSGTAQNAVLNFVLQRAASAIQYSRVQYTSLLGCLGGAANAVHDDALINTYLASATSTNPVKLIVDQWLNTKGITIPPTGNVTIEGLGRTTGWYLADGTNTVGFNTSYNGNVISCGPVRPYDPGYTNGNPGAGVTPPARIAVNIRLANFRIYGNRENNPTAFQFGIDIVNGSNIDIDGVVVEHASSYGIRLSNCSLFRVRDCDLMPFLMNEAPVFHANTDGVHLDGPCEHWSITGGRYRCGDDAIALNGPEGYSGSITDGFIGDIDFTDSMSFVRVYPNNVAGSQRKIARITMRGLRGNIATDTSGTAHAGILLGNATSPADMIPAAIEDILIDGLEVSGMGNPVVIAENIGSVELRNCKWRIPASNTFTAFVTSWAVPVTVERLTVRDLTYIFTNYNPTTHGGSAAVDFQNGSYGQGYPWVATVGHITVDGFKSITSDGTTIADGTGGVDHRLRYAVDAFFVLRCKHRPHAGRTPADVLQRKWIGRRDDSESNRAGCLVASVGV